MAILSPAEIIKALKGASEDDKDKIRKALGMKERKDTTDPSNPEAVKARIAELEHEESMAAKLSDRIAMLKAQAALGDILAKAFEEAFKNQTQHINSLKQSGDEVKRQQGEELERLRLLAEKHGEQSKEHDKYMKAYESSVRSSLDMTEKKIENTEKKAKAAKKELDEIGEAGERMAEKLTGAFSDVARKMKITTMGGSSLLKSLGMISEHATSPQGIKALQTAFAKTFSSINIAASALFGMVGILKDFVSSVDNAASALAAFSGTGTRNAVMIGELKEANIAYGISADDIGKANQDLISGFGAFSLMNKTAQKAMVETVTQLQKIGVAGQDATEIMETLTKGLGVSVDEATKLTKNFAIMARQLGTTAGKMAKDFAGAMPTLMVYGNKSQKVFKGLAAQAAKSGVEMSKLIDIAKQFDTFEGSAQAVGKLNQMLGSNLDSNTMLLMTEEQRIETLIQTVQASGIAFKDMGKFQKLAIANAAGITDMNVALKLFGMNTAQYRKHAKEAQMMEDQQAKINEMMMAATPIMLQLKMAFMQLAISLTPYIEDLRVGVTMLSKFIKENKDMIRVIMGVGGFLAAVKVLSFALNAMTFGIIPKLIAGLFTMGTTMTTTAAAGTGAAGTLGASMKGLAVAAAASMQSIAVGIVGFIRTIGTVGEAAKGALKTIGIMAAIALILGVAAAAAYGFATAISIATDAGIRLFNLLRGAGVEATLSVVKSLALLQSQLESFAYAAPVIAGGFGVMALAIGGFALALRLIPFDRIETLAELSKGFTNMKSAEVKASYKAASSFVSTLDDKRENIKPLLENMAIITGGKGAETGALGVLTSAINNVGKKVEEAGASAQKAVNIKIDSDGVRKLFMEGAYSAFAGTGVLG